VRSDEDTETHTFVRLRDGLGFAALNEDDGCGPVNAGMEKRSRGRRGVTYLPKSCSVWRWCTDKHGLRLAAAEQTRDGHQSRKIDLFRRRSIQHRHGHVVHAI
jgi:ABC-type lipopolysaccharide export system ATPase subunit